MNTSFVPTPRNQTFLIHQIQKGGVNKTKVINKALDLYRKYTLAADLKASFSAQTDEDVAEAMSDFEDYLKIVDEN